MQHTMLIMLIACLGIAIWGFNSALVELSKQHPREPLSSLRLRYDVDDYIWSKRAPPAIRRRYAVSMMCVPLGLVFLAGFVWSHEANVDRKLVGVGLAILAAAFITVSLARKIVTRGL